MFTGADCGYVYDREIDGDGLYFEELKKGFVCPQCQAPRYFNLSSKLIPPMICLIITESDTRRRLETNGA